MNDKIIPFVDQLIEAYDEPIEIVEGLEFDWNDTLKKIEFYSNNKYMSGNLDALGRPKPFYNVSTYRVTVAKIATDLDVKDIRFEADNPMRDSIPTMMYNRALFNYLKESNFSEFLNEFGKTRPKYGKVIVKKCYEPEEDELEIKVQDWKNVKVNPANIAGSPIVTEHYLQPSEIVEKSWDNVSELFDAHAKATKNKPTAILVKEIHGEFPESMYPDNDPDDENLQSKYALMCFYIGYAGKKKFILHYEYEDELPFKWLDWERVPGRDIGRGIPEEGFDAQWATNDAILSTKQAQDLSGKVVLATTSKKVSGNVLTDIQNGHIFELEPNTTINSLNLAPSTLPQFERTIALWEQQYNRVASSFDANTGEAPTAGTPYSQTALLNQVANSPFEYQREVAGIFLNEILNDWIKPFLKKRLKNSENLVADFSDEELDIIDESIANYEGNRRAIDMLLEGEAITPEEYNGTRETVKTTLKKTGKRREIKMPKGYLDIEGRITANITGELKNKAAMLQSLDNVLKTITATFNPQTGKYAALEDPTLSKIFAHILEIAGLPVTIGTLKGSSQGTQSQMTADLSAVQPVSPITPNANATPIQ